MDRDNAIKEMRELLKLMIEKKSSDMFITFNYPPAMKIDGLVTPVRDNALDLESVKAMCYAIMNDRQVKEFEVCQAMLLQ